MSGLKSILCLFDGDEAQVNGLDLACALSLRHKAFLHVLHVTPPVDPYLELDRVQEAAVAMSKTIGTRHIAERVRAKVQQMEKGQWRGVLDRGTFHETGVGFEAIVGFADKVIPRIARSNDLIICAKPASAPNSGQDVFLSTLSRSGRPLLLIPGRMPHAFSPALFDGVVAVAWDRSIQATRAIHSLLPFLGSAGQVHLISVVEHHKKIDVRDDAAIVHWLRRQGYTPHVSNLVQTDRPVGAMLLSKAAEIEATVLVAGAFGQNVIVEKLIGGTTVDMYRHAELPLLLSH